MSYEWVDHTAELELHVDAATPEDVFRDALQAVAELLGPGSGEQEERELALTGAGRDRLLWAWLDELFFLGETEGFVPEAAELELGQDRLRAAVSGRAGEPAPLVKAVTYHGLAFEEVDGRYRARVVLDV